MCCWVLFCSNPAFTDSWSWLSGFHTKITNKREFWEFGVETSIAPPYVYHPVLAYVLQPAWFGKCVGVKNSRTPKACVCHCSIFRLMQDPIQKPNHDKNRKGNPLPSTNSALNYLYSRAQLWESCQVERRSVPALKPPPNCCHCLTEWEYTQSVVACRKLQLSTISWSLTGGFRLIRTNNTK